MECNNHIYYLVLSAGLISPQCAVPGALFSAPPSLPQQPFVFPLLRPALDRLWHLYYPRFTIIFSLY